MFSIIEKIRNIIWGQLGCSMSKIVNRAKLSELGADSLDKANILFEVEETFDIFITDEDADGIVTVGDLVKYVQGAVK